MVQPGDSPGARSEDEEYNRLALLEDLESLLEEIEDLGITALDSGQAVPSDIRERMEELGVRDGQQVRDRIMRLHAQLDEGDQDLRITES